MNPKDAAGWIETDKFLKECPNPPAWLARLVAKKLPEAMRKAIPYKAPIRLPRGAKQKAKRVPLPKLKKELDRVFSLFIRQRDARGVGLSWEDGFGRCCTCSYVAHWMDMDCGHYAPRQDLATRWEEKNCHLQCKSCNGFRGGEAEKMAIYIDDKYGAGTAEKLRAQAKQPFRLNRQWLESGIVHYKALIGESASPPKAGP